MLRTAADDALRPLARRLDADKMAGLGIDNTMRLAKRYNGLLYGRYQRYRERQLRLLLGQPPRVRMEDGFAIDTSGSLPHLDRLLVDAEEVIAERAGTGETDDRYRAFFRNIIKVEDLERWPSFLDFVCTPELLGTVAHYMGFVPALSSTLPAGVRFVESGEHLDALAHLPPRDSQLFHIDPYDSPMVYVLVLLRDCEPDMGPFTFLGASTSERAARALGYRRRGHPYRLSDEEIYSVVDPSEQIEFTYPRGTVLFVDTSRCFHYGSRAGKRPRFQMMYGLTSVCRSDFSESYMPGDSYRLKASDNGLRRLVLDRRAYEEPG